MSGIIDHPLVIQGLLPYISPDLERSGLTSVNDGGRCYLTDLLHLDNPQYETESTSNVGYFNNTPVFVDCFRNKYEKNYLRFKTCDPFRSLAFFWLLVYCFAVLMFVFYKLYVLRTVCNSDKSKLLQ